MDAIGVDNAFQVSENVEEPGWFCVQKGLLHETRNTDRRRRGVHELREASREFRVQ